jgi:hypothetical protein
MSYFDLQNKLEEQCLKADDLRNKMFQGTSLFTPGIKTIEILYLNLEQM